MKRRRGIPAITVCAVLLFGAAVAIWLVTLFVTSPATNYANAPACTSGTSAPAGCRTTVDATVTGAGYYTQSHSTGYWVTLKAPGVSTRSQAGAIGDWGVMHLKAGQHVKVALWAGGVVSVASSRYTAYTFGNPPQDRYSVVWISIFFLVAALALGRIYRDPLFGERWSRWLWLVDVSVVPALFAAVLAFMLHRGLIAFAAIVLVGTVAGLSYLPAMAWRREEERREDPFPTRRRTTQRLRGTGPGLPPWAEAKAAACPVDRTRQQWIERSVRWFARQFGAYAAQGEVAIPAPEFYPAGYAARPEQIRALFERICVLMYVDPRRIRLLLRDGLGTTAPAGSKQGRRVVGRFRAARLGRDRIELDTAEAADPLFATAVIAHELGHERLLGERRITSRRRDHERLTDLITVYFGMGVFTANAAAMYGKAEQSWSAEPLGELTEAMLNGAGDERHLGYLNEREFGYALAYWAQLRGESNPLWMRHLDAGVRAYMRQGLAYLAQRGENSKVEV